MLAYVYLAGLVVFAGIALYVAVSLRRANNQVNADLRTLELPLECRIQACTCKSHNLAKRGPLL